MVSGMGELGSSMDRDGTTLAFFSLFLLSGTSTYSCKKTSYLLILYLFICLGHCRTTINCLLRFDRVGRLGGVLYVAW